MRRWLPIFLFCVALIAPFALRRAVVRQAVSNARGNMPRLVIVTPHNQDIRQAFAAAFDAWHRARYGVGVVLDYRTPGGTTDIERLLLSTYQAYRGSDGKLPESFHPDLEVVWGGGDYFFDQTLKPQHLLQPIDIGAAALHSAFPIATLGGVRLYDSSANSHGRPTPEWVGVCLSSFGIVYNPQLYAALKMPFPQKWDDLADERLASLIALADPSHSGSAALTYEMVVQRAMADREEEFFTQHPPMRAVKPSDLAHDHAYHAAISAGWKRGMQTLLRIAANARYFSDDSQTPPTDVSRGEASAGMAIDFYARVTEQAVGSDRARFVAPANATAITPDPVAILAGVRGEQLTLATRFVEFLLTPEAQRLWIVRSGKPGGPSGRGLGRTPIRSDVYGDQTNWAPTEDPFKQTGNFNERGEWMNLFSETRLIWFAAWIDSRDSLRSAYQRVLSIDDPAVRAKRIEKLADLPIEMSDVEQMHAEKKKQPAVLLDEWLARQRIDWAIKFRDHYEKVASEKEQAS